MSQTEWLRVQLLLGRKITPMDSLKEAGCFRLAARVQELRREGLAVQSRMVQRNTKRFAEYWI